MLFAQLNVNKYTRHTSKSIRNLHQKRELWITASVRAAILLSMFNDMVTLECSYLVSSIHLGFFVFFAFALMPLCLCWLMKRSPALLCYFLLACSPEFLCELAPVNPACLPTCLPASLVLSWKEDGCRWQIGAGPDKGIDPWSCFSLSVTLGAFFNVFFKFSE